MSNIRIRLIRYIKYKNISTRSFEQSIGAANGFVSSIRKGVSYEKIEQITKRYPDLNREWLLFGEGNMLVGEEKSDFQEKSEGGAVSAYEIPLLPISARGGTLDGFSEQIMSYNCDKILSPINGVDFAIPITGDSMCPEYPSGSIVLIKKIDELAFIQWGCVFVLDTCNGVICKKVMPTNDSSIIECISINKEYPSFQVNLKDVYGIYRVLMMMLNK